MPLLTQQGNGHVFIQQTTPTGASTGDLWSDTSSSPPPLKKYNGTSWDSVETPVWKLVSLG